MGQDLKNPNKITIFNQVDLRPSWNQAKLTGFGLLLQPCGNTMPDLKKIIKGL